MRASHLRRGAPRLHRAAEEILEDTRAARHRVITSDRLDLVKTSATVNLVVADIANRYQILFRVLSPVRMVLFMV